ncbi:formamidopyrimidine-DNA glycosylase [Devosia pacifica]|uniref:Formamidopyrimidine-DNA glycosylase n=1 Tax=Devosia pacifica TaxID=1335967 RepID=A0A918S3B8_9HYPH|nr:bifunctional DNA-formamidopyrimidine glycosylase/DNA-(apurinic or apyrimidinic site) lyase [Devosia pacifica]GHA22821.1 formamidopyrimidine-DNA glycosylase [Devosia pacifica]
MPELPEVETVRRGLEPYLTDARIEAVTLNRKDLRFPFPEGFAKALEGRTIVRVDRRAKYLLVRLDDGNTVLSHLGMSGAYRFTERDIDQPTRYYETNTARKHDHMIWSITHPTHGPLHLVYSDPRRFGFVDLFAEDQDNRYTKDLGPEPLGNEFDADMLAARFRTKAAPVKAGLLDQRVVAGLGNIYVCEALHRAHILPTVKCSALVKTNGHPKAVLEDLVLAIRKVLIEAIEAGGSTLRDFRAADGASGYFQMRFAVYDREDEPCPTPLCTGTVKRIVQSGRSTFYCPRCQKRVR